MTYIEVLHKYLHPNVEYNHQSLKLAYYKACNDGYGTMFRLGIDEGYAHGLVSMPNERFLFDVMAAYPRPSKLHPVPVIVPGVLVLLDLAEGNKQ